mgnify:FL=1
MVHVGLCGQCSGNMFELRDKTGTDLYGTDRWEDKVGDSFFEFNPDYPDDEGYVSRDHLLL